MAVGISMVIDDKFLERLSAADGKLEELAKKSEEVRGRIVASFRSMGDDGVGYFIQRINEAKAALQGLNVGGSVSLDLKGLDKIPQTATMSADNINMLITSITKLAEANASIVSSSNSATTSIKDMFSIFKEKISDVEKLAKAEEALVKQNEILSRMQNATLAQKQKNVDYETQLLDSKRKTDAITAEKNATQELAIAESNRHKDAMDQAQAEAREIQARGIEQKRIADEKVNDAKRSTIAVKEEENAIKQSLAEQRRAAMDISLETKKYRNQTKLAAEQDKTATMQAIALERERQAELKRSMEEVKRLAKAYKAMPTLMTGETLNKLLGESASAASINQRIAAIHNLKNSLKDLDTTDKEYKNNVAKVNAEIARLTKELNGLGVASNSVQKSHRNLMDVSGQLARKLALVFSVSQIQGYISRLASVRGEFELQQKSLQVLLQNRDEANKLWQQTVELAVKSPFRVSELVSYTRQLAAYRIETSKLHETTRKLADVSAGLGVDMNRLILAYGQVRAAEYLRGTELRQFTEAGIPMLDELAKRFSELEGRAVSAGDVFERISKRMVGFEDVAAVFDKMTSAGGTFYKMQEEQSETLKGMISNFRDSVDIMLNDIGKSNEGILKGTVNVARMLVEQWQTLAVILKSLITLIAIYRVGMILTSQKMIETAVNAGITNGEMVKQIKLTQLLSIGWKKVSASLQTAGAVFKASLPLMATTAFLAGVIKVIGTFYEHSKQLEEISKKYAKLRDQLTEISYAFNNAVDEKDIQTQKQKLESLVSLANNEYHMKIKVDLTGATEEDIQKMFGELQTRLTEVNAYANMFETAMQKSTEWQWSDLFDKTKNMSEVIQNAYSTLAANVASDVNGLRDNFDELSESEKAAFEILKQPKKVDETDVEYLQRLNNGYSTLINSAQEAIKARDQYSTQSNEYRKANEEVLKIWNRLTKAGIDYHQIRKALAAQDKAQTAAQKEYNEALDESKELFKALENIPESEKEIRLKAAIDKLAFEKDWNDVVTDYIMRWTEQRFNIKFNIVPDEKKPLAIWQENYNKQFESYYGYKKIENADTTREKEVQRINGFLKEQKDLVERIQKAGTGRGTAYEGYDLDEEKRKLEELQKQIDWFGVSDKKKNEEQIKILNNRINLIKELNKEYVKLNMTMSSENARKTVAESFKDTFRKAFEGTGISLSSLVVNDKALSDLKEQSEKAGSTISESILSELEKLKEAGTYIRTFDDEFLASIKKREGFRAKVYKDAGGVKTQGYGETINIEEGKTWDKEKAELVLRDSLTQRYVAQLNKVLDNNKELVLTQKQYNALLDLTYQGGIGATKQLLSRVEDTEKGVAYIDSIYEKIKKQVGEKSAERFGEAFINKFKEAESIYERISMMLEISNLTIQGSINKAWYAGMQRRSDERASMFRGDLAVSEQIKGIFQEVGSFDFTNLKGVVEELKKLAPLAKKEGKEAELALSKAISEVQAEIDLQINVEEDKSIQRQIEDMFGNYELSLELDKMNVPQDLASQLFGIESMDIQGLKAKLNEATKGLFDYVYKLSELENANNYEQLQSNEEYLKLKQAMNEKYSQEDINIAQNAAKKLMDMEDKARMDRLKKYTNYLIAAQSETVKIKLEEARKIAEIESMAEMTPAQKEIAKGAVREETQKKLDKQQWDDFKNTDLYIELFEDLDNVSTNTLNRMKAKLVEMRDSLKNLDPSQLKEIAKRIEEVNEALVSKNPFKGMFSSIKNVFTGYNEYKKAAEKALVSQEEVDTQKQVVDNLQLQVEAQKKVVYEKSKSGKASRVEQAVEKTYLSQLENQLSKEQIILNKKKEQAKADEKEKNAKKEILGLSKQQLSEAAKVLDQQLGALNDIKGSWESVFGSMSDGLSDAFDSIQEIGGGISNVISGLSQGPAGYLQAAAGVMQTIGGIFNIGDKKKERQIQREIKKVEELQHAYEKLEKAIDDAYAIDTLQRSTKNAQANLRKQIASYERMIAAEQDKKDTDQDRIREWRYEIEDLKEQIKELNEEAFSQATGGIIDNVLNAATEFTDAWLEAFKETGNGLSGLEDNFKEAVTNMLKQQASMLITSAYVNRWKSELERYINTDDLELTTEEARKWVESVKSSLPQLNTALEEYFNAMKAAGIDLGGDYEMSGLARSIQGITESQADILAAYANSCRFFLANIDATLTSVANQILGGENMPNPILSELRTQTELVRGISTLLNSVVRGSHSMGGQGIKVFIS